MQSMATMSSAQIISATAFHSKMALPGLPRPAYPAVSGVSESVSWRGWGEDTWVFERVLGPAQENPENIRKNGPKGIVFVEQICHMASTVWVWFFAHTDVKQ